jgi:adenylate kinase family enzyme
MAKKIILVLFPPIVNSFDFHSRESELFIDSKNLKKAFLQKKDIRFFKQKELLNLTDIDYNSEISEIIKQRTENMAVLVNYPHTKKHFKSLNEELVKNGQKINIIILLNVSNYELITDIQNEYLICPICEKIYRKEEVIKENKDFVCPIDNEYHFSLEEISKFNDYIVSYYLTNGKELVEEFLRENNGSSNIIQLTISQRDEIFSGKIKDKLLELIRSI